jgi:SAM-dependent methyltransferase
MINYLHSLWHRPEKGWDPVPATHAESYAGLESNPMSVVDELRDFIDDFKGKTVIDLGGGPGHHSVAFARAGAKVLWFDISRNYEEMARRRAREAGMEIEFVRGYLEDAARLGRTFDIVYNRACFYYSMNDRKFAKIVYDLVKPGGIGYCSSLVQTASPMSLPRAVQTWMNSRLWIKVGHPYPPHRRLANLYHQFPVDLLRADYRAQRHDIVIFIKSDSVTPIPGKPRVAIERKSCASSDPNAAAMNKQ